MAYSQENQKSVLQNKKKNDFILQNSEPNK